MDGAEVAVNCLCSVRSCATCWCPDNELANAHRGECQYRRMAEVMEELDAARDELLEEDGQLKGRVKDVKEVEKRAATLAAAIAALAAVIAARAGTRFNNR